MAGAGVSKSASKDYTPREYKPLRQYVATQLPEAYANPTSYSGPLYSPITQNESSILSNLQGQTNPFGQQASREQLLSTIQGNSAGYQSLLDEAVNAASKDITDYAQQQNLSQRALFGRAGQTLSESSPFAMAQARDNAAVLDALQKASVGIRLPAMMQERQNQLQAVGMLSDLNQSDLAREMSILEAQGLPRMIEEQGITRGIDLFKEQQQRVMEAMRMLTAITVPTPAAKNSSSVNASICWVADELYGEGSTKAKLARRWAHAHPGSLFIRLYTERGEGWAAFLKANRWAKEIARPIWDAMVGAQLALEGV